MFSPDAADIIAIIFAMSCRQDIYFVSYAARHALRASLRLSPATPFFMPMLLLIFSAAPLLVCLICFHMILRRRRCLLMLMRQAFSSPMLFAMLMFTFAALRRCFRLRHAHDAFDFLQSAIFAAAAAAFLPLRMPLLLFSFFFSSRQRQRSYFAASSPLTSPRLTDITHRFFALLILRDATTPAATTAPSLFFSFSCHAIICC